MHHERAVDAKRKNFMMTDKEVAIWIRPFYELDVLAVQDLIHQAIGASYDPVYPPRALGFFNDLHSGVKILNRHREGEILS
jgi:hypothetical protein